MTEIQLERKYDGGYRARAGELVVDGQSKAEAVEGCVRALWHQRPAAKNLPQSDATWWLRHWAVSEGIQVRDLDLEREAEAAASPAVRELAQRFGGSIIRAQRVLSARCVTDLQASNAGAYFDGTAPTVAPDLSRYLTPPAPAMTIEQFAQQYGLDVESVARYGDVAASQQATPTQPSTGELDRFAAEYGLTAEAVLRYRSMRSVAELSSLRETGDDPVGPSVPGSREPSPSITQARAAEDRGEDDDGADQPDDGVEPLKPAAKRPIPQQAEDEITPTANRRHQRITGPSLAAVLAEGRRHGPDEHYEIELDAYGRVRKWNELDAEGQVIRAHTPAVPPTKAHEDSPPSDLLRAFDSAQ